MVAAGKLLQDKLCLVTGMSQAACVSEHCCSVLDAAAYSCSHSEWLSQAQESVSSLPALSGASRGIGAAIAEAYAREGGRLILVAEEDMQAELDKVRRALAQLAVCTVAQQSSFRAGGQVV